MTRQVGRRRCAQGHVVGRKRTVHECRKQRTQRDRLCRRVVQRRVEAWLVILPRVALPRIGRSCVVWSPAESSSVTTAVAQSRRSVTAVMRRIVERYSRGLHSVD